MQDGGEQIVPVCLELSDTLRLDDRDLNRLRRSSEDHFVERKSFGDWKKDAVKTVVAFANSAPIGQPAVLFIGVKDGGDVEVTSADLDGIQKKLSEMLRSVFPRVHYVAKAITEGGRCYLAVIVNGSENRPHFAGPSYIRVGSETREANEEEFQALISQRSAKVYEIQKWMRRTISITILGGCELLPAVLVDCNQFYLTWRDEPGRIMSIPLERTQLSYDHENGRLKVYVTDPR